MLSDLQHKEYLDLSVWAAKRCRLYDIVKTLAEHGANLKSRAASSRNLLREAHRRRYEHTYRSLLESRAYKEEEEARDIRRGISDNNDSD